MLHILSFASENEVNSKDLVWIRSEPIELIQSEDYKKWLKNYEVVNEQSAKKLGYDSHNIRYALLDVTNDGVNEIVVQDATWFNGYAFATFQQFGNKWRAIVTHRGGFVFKSYGSKPMRLTLYRKFNADYETYELIYTKEKYKVNSTKSLKYAPNFLEEFSALNNSRAEQCKENLLELYKYRSSKENKNGCNLSNEELMNQNISYCDSEGIAMYKRTCLK
jgi:hypothetical protein